MALTDDDLSSRCLIGLDELVARSDLTHQDLIPIIGGKASWLVAALRSGEMAATDVAIPNGFVLTMPNVSASLGTRSTEAHVVGASDEAIAEWYERTLRVDTAVAVRSSSVVEDGEERSFAGEFFTELDVTGAPRLRQAIRRVLDCRDPASMAVLVQKMIRGGNPPRGGSPFGEDSIGGVLLSDPTSGSQCPILVEAVMGGAEHVVDGSSDPFALVLDRSGDVVTRDAKGILSRQSDSIVARAARKIVASSAVGDEPAHRVWDQPDSVGLIPRQLARRLSRLATAAERVLDSQRLSKTALSESALDGSVPSYRPRGADLEWVWTPSDDALYLLQIRPLVRSQASPKGQEGQKQESLDSEVVISGWSVGDGVATGLPIVATSVDEAAARLAEIDPTQPCILVVATTSPEWLPVIRSVVGVVADIGGRTSHAAIVCRELGIPALVGCRDAVRGLSDIAEHGGEIRLQAKGEGLAGTVTVLPRRQVSDGRPGIESP